MSASGEQAPPILLVDDERGMKESLDQIVKDAGFDLHYAESAEAALRLVEERDYLMVISDVRLGGMSGQELLESLHADRPELPVALITAYATPRLAVEAIRAGAIDYLSKPYEPEELLAVIERGADRWRLLTENVALRNSAQGVCGLERIVGESAAMDELRRLIRTVAPTDATALILGESGVGKELIAGALHGLSRRASRTFVRLNCAAIPENLLESELFGHEKGAFTGAVRQKIGQVEVANGGTLFLDEVGDMSRPLQAKLLRFLEDGAFTRVGDTEERRVDVRLVAATNRDIVQAIQAQEFREDLYHRLNVVQFRPPPLRERGDDILILAELFLGQFCAAMNKPRLELSAEARERLLSHHWPGNVRELRNAIERAVILESEPVLSARNLPDFRVESQLNAPAESLGDRLLSRNANETLEASLERVERELILGSLERNDYNMTRSAEELGLSRHALRYRIQRLELPMTRTGIESG